jgi:hypothetical protein
VVGRRHRGPFARAVTALAAALLAGQAGAPPSAAAAR